MVRGITNNSAVTWLPYGDDPHDQFWIKQGIDYARQHGY
ncbi:hypothetical protein WP8W19C02_38600 [Enterobacter cloacae]|nr:hypothetical protein WP8W19C02_38600 [Enterobacter cloacae]